MMRAVSLAAVSIGLAFVVVSSAVLCRRAIVATLDYAFAAITSDEGLALFLFGLALFIAGVIGLALEALTRSSDPEA